ncbi:MAG: hypothetical protein ACTSQP_08575 [Promethearchaeota archaeon]
MPNEFDFRNFKTIEEFNKTVEGVRYLHDLYLKAVNHPIRREMLEIINEKKRISEKELIQILKDKDIINDDSIFKYNMDFLIKAFCVNKIEEDDAVYYEITQSGKVVDYLDK